MLKKKNIAMAMAATVVATSVAPAFAATLDGSVIATNDTEKVAQLKEEIKALLDVKYSKTAELVEVDSKTPENGSNVYEIKVSVNGGLATEIKEMEELDIALAKLTKKGDHLNITVVDNGHKTVDGEIVNYKEGKVEKTDIVKLLDGTTTSNYVTDIAKVDENTVSLTLKNNKEPLTIAVGNVKLNLGAPIYKVDSVGNYLDKDGKVIAADKEADRVVTGFEKAKVELVRTGEETDLEKDRTYGVNFSDVITKEFAASDLYDAKANRFTRVGNELVKYIAAYNDADGKDVTISKGAEKTALTIELPVEKEIKTYSLGATGSYAQIVVNGSVSEIAALYNALETPENVEVQTLGGTDRYKTAIEVSKSAFTDKESAENIVLVSGKSLADGLAATPFAMQKNAPVLLTGTDKVSDETMAEIERAMETDGTVYLIGGEASISKSVEVQLKAAGLKIERIKGSDRYETSLAIANKMKKADEVFVAGGYAMADAMSVASVAAKGGAKTTDANPILLVNPKTGLSEKQSDFLNIESQDADVFVVGGESSVTSDVEGQIKTSGTVKRIKGADRQETNAKVIKEFYTDAIDTLYVAKSDNNGLVDALSAGVAAAKDDAPVVLATNDLHASQESVLTTLDKALSVDKKEIGYGIASQVWEKIAKIFE